MKLILASQSPRRRELLSMLGLHIDIFVPDTEEDCDRSVLSPEELVMGLACRKARAAAEQLSLRGDNLDNAVILAADTVVALDGTILEKPTDEDDARRMLTMLSSRRHEVFTGIAAIYRGRLAVDVQTTGVSFRVLTNDMIDAYIASGEPMDKAGAYGIQGGFSRWVRGIDGCYFGVVGLPVNALNDLFFKVTGKYL